MGLIKIFLLLIFTYTLQAQTNTVALATEITRLERASNASGVTPERYNAFLGLAHLNQLSGNSEAALKTYERALAVFPADGRLLLEQGRLFISLGEFDKAAATAAALLSQGKEILSGRYLLALTEAFRSGNTALLAALADDPEFSAYHSGICYTLWKLTGSQVYRSRLTADFRGSPEEKIANTNPAGSAVTVSAITPLWLLFPGRENLGISAATGPAPQMAVPQMTVPQMTVPINPPSQGTASQTPVPQAPVTQTAVLQTGLFGREENAQALSERLRRAGFANQIVKRQVNGSDFWAVNVPAGNDMNATIKKLKDAGFDSFPVKS
ncbi:MAG: SPOR domain-containing protein [Treponema sp.]|jgi:hypothetical protein|nr:SPOR domain-containing protein [Treponema sp.]